MRQRLLGTPPFAAVAGLDELALERRREPRQVLLRDEVVRPGLEDRDRRRLVDGSRYDDERQVEARAFISARASAQVRSVSE